MRKARQKPARTVARQAVRMRRPDDCMIAGVANALSWTYERAAEVLGAACDPKTGHPTMPAGTGYTMQQIIAPLLSGGVAASYVVAQEHPEVQQDQRFAALRARASFFPSKRVKRLIQGRRAILLGNWKGEDGREPVSQGHAFGWDGARVLGENAPADLSETTLWAALILNPIEEVEARPESVPIAGTSLPEIFARHDRVYVGFSGGRDSIVLAHMCEPWREKTTLLWVRPTHHAAHMADFVRGYAERGWRLEEIPSPPLQAHWQATGIPVDILPVDNGIGRKEPRLQPWVSCCYAVRHSPLITYLTALNEPCAFLTGQRAEDQAVTAGALGAQLPAHVEAAHPFYDWKAADVAAYVERHGLTLPRQYAQGYADSIECLTCPVMTPQRAAYLRQRFPQAAQFATATALKSADAVAAALGDLYAVMLQPAEHNRTETGHVAA